MLQVAHAQEGREDPSRVIIRAGMEIGSIAASSDGKLLAGCEVQGLAAGIWNVTERRQVAVIHDPGEICALQFVPETRLLAVATEHFVKVWNLKPAVEAASAATLDRLNEQPDISRAFTLFLQPDAPSLVTYEPVMSVRVRDDRDESSLLSSIAVSPDGSRIAALASLQKEIVIAVIDREASTIEWSKRLSAAGKPWPHGAFSRDGKLLYTTGLGLAAWDAASGKPVYYKDSELLVGAVDVSSDGRYLATAVAKPPRSGLALWNARTGERLRLHLSDKSGPRHSVLFLPSSKLVLGSGRTPALQIWNPDTDTLSVVSSTDQVISDLALTSSGAKVLSSSTEGTVRIWDVGRVGQALPDDAPVDR
jgi:WD40 repeat protein